MLGVIDYGAGNLRSVLHALNHLGLESPRVVQRESDLRGVDRLILPGVGAFGAGMQQLHTQGLVKPLKAMLADGVPYLGICLGMQFLFEYSDEMGQHDGLGVLPGHVTRFDERPGRKVPHMGWNRVQPTRPSDLFSDADESRYAYFVHSYYCVPKDANDLTATANYGQDFAIAVQRGNIYGVQFHPEKSQRTGLDLLERYLRVSEKKVDGAPRA